MIRYVIRTGDAGTVPLLALDELPPCMAAAAFRPTAMFPFFLSRVLRMFYCCLVFIFFLLTKDYSSPHVFRRQTFWRLFSPPFFPQVLLLPLKFMFFLGTACFPFFFEWSMERDTPS